MMDQKSKKMSSLKLLLSLFFVTAVLLPLSFMLANIASVDMGAIFSSEQFKKALGNSLLLSVCTTAVSMALAAGLAFSLTRTRILGRQAISVIATLPMLIPSISHGMSLIILFGANGLLTRLFHLQSSIYGFKGVLIGSVLYSFPVAFLMLYDVLRYEDFSTYEAADILGVPKHRQFTAITLPYLKKPLLNVAFAVFTLVITDYGVPLMVGGGFTTLPVMMYQEVIGLLNFGKGSAIGLVLLIPALLAFVVDLYTREDQNQNFIDRRARIRPNLRRDLLAGLFCGAVCLLVLVPAVTFGILTFVKKYPTDLSFSMDHIIRAWEMGAGKYLFNSLVIAFAAGAIGTVLAYLTAYISRRVPGRNSRLLHLFAITSMAVPGMVLGLAYALCFKGSFLYGTMLILITVNVVHFFSSPYLIAYNSFGKINENIEAVGATLGVNRFYLLRDVFLPQMQDTLIEMFSYFFVNCMMTISAVSFLYTLGTMPLSLMINQFEAQMLLECSAFVSIVILLINLAMKGAAALMRKRKMMKEV